MKLAVWNPFREMNILQRTFDEFFDGLPIRSDEVCPATELVDKDDALTVTVEVPGLDKDEVELTVLGDILTIAGEKKLPTEEDVTYIRHERPHGKFRRLIDLPYSVDPEKISATYKDGTLTVKLPKAEEAKPKQIEVM